MIVYRMLPDGGFVAGDTDTERTSYAFPTSTYATQAKRNAADTAAQMMERHPSNARHPRVLEFDTRNWVRLNERGGSRFA